MIEPRAAFDLVTAAMIVALSALGIALRIRRAIRLRRIILVEPADRRDVDYLASVKRSTYLRMGVKVVFLLGGLFMLSGAEWIWPVWRGGIVVALAFMLAETHGVDGVRDRLGRTAEDER